MSSLGLISFIRSSIISQMSIVVNVWPNEEVQCIHSLSLSVGLICRMGKFIIHYTDRINNTYSCRRDRSNL